MSHLRSPGRIAQTPQREPMKPIRLTNYLKVGGLGFLAFLLLPVLIVGRRRRLPGADRHGGDSSTGAGPGVRPVGCVGRAWRGGGGHRRNSCCDRPRRGRSRQSGRSGRGRTAKSSCSALDCMKWPYGSSFRSTCSTNCWRSTAIRCSRSKSDCNSFTFLRRAAVKALRSAIAP